MSRIARYPIVRTKSDVTIVGDAEITVNGSLGTLSRSADENVTVTVEIGEVSFAASNETRHARAMAGTMRSLVNNMVIGVSSGFNRKLNLVGVGFRAQAQGQSLRLQLGFSHDIVYDLPEGITVECPSATEIIVKGSNKQVVGQVAAEIRGYRPPEPYKGKGVRYEDERVIMKEAKKK